MENGNKQKKFLNFFALIKFIKDIIKGEIMVSYYES